MNALAYLINLATAISQLVNAMVGGHPDETLSARAWRGHIEGNAFWSMLRLSLNSVFFWQVDHCRSSFLADCKRAEQVLAWAKRYGGCE